MASHARAVDIDPGVEPVAPPSAQRVLIFAHAANDTVPNAVDPTIGAAQTTASLGALRVQQEATPLASGTISYAYDALGRMASRTVAGSEAETFQFDAIGRLITHAGDLGSFTLSYLGQTGQITGRQLAGSTLATSWGYLPNTGDRRLASVGTVGPVSGQSTSFQYTSNAADLTTGVTQTSDAAVPYPPGTLAQTATYNDLNQLTAFTNPNPPPTNRHPTFDLDGNMLTNGTRVFSWDGENRLVGITYPGQPGKATAFAYDGLGRRAAITSTPAGGPAVTTSYIWCGDRPCQARNSADAVTRGYYAEGEFTPGTPAQSDYYAPDQIGSVRRVFTASAAPTFDYDPYGNALQATAPVTDFNYAGMFYNTDSGLYLTQYRAYDPSVGRWLSRDPIGEGGDPEGNLYGYVGGEPVGATDRGGECPWCIAAGIIIGAGIQGGAEAWLQYQEHGKICSWGSVLTQAGIGGIAGGFGFLGGAAFEGAPIALRIGYQAYNAAKFGLVGAAISAAMNGQTGPQAVGRMASATFGAGIGGAAGEAASAAGGALGGPALKEAGDVYSPIVGGAVDQTVENGLPDTSSPFEPRK